MAHYRKIDVRIWNDEKFHRLTTHGKLAFLYLVTHPNMTNLGAMRATAESLSDELEVLPEAFAEAFKEGLAEADPKAKCILVKNFVKYQSAESPNVIKSWAKQLDFIPECGLKVQAIQYVKDYVEGLGEAFKEAFAKAFPESLSTKHLTLSKQQEVPKQVTSHEVIVLPDWLPVGAWNAFVDMRKSIKKPMTDRAIVRAINKLDGFRKQGYDIEAIIDASENSKWTDFYEPKERPKSSDPTIDFMRRMNGLAA